jgi:hypothetical protein
LTSCLEHFLVKNIHAREASAGRRALVRKDGGHAAEKPCTILSKGWTILSSAEKRAESRGDDGLI